MPFMIGEKFRTGEYRRLLREIREPLRIGWFIEDSADLSADLVFASVAKLSRPENLTKLRTERFDYVVIDEVHHASAGSYRRILDEVDPRFLLGLTATPDRSDAADVLGLFDDHIAYRADIARGVALGRLVPFKYYGVKDDIDYANIPWRNRSWDIEALATAAQTEARMATLWRARKQHPASRSLVFCCSIPHADFVRAWLRQRGVRVAAVCSGPGSDGREQAMRELATGELDALCAVDVFNEGIDLPVLDRVVMLRPTESSLLFLQQLGRGLRESEGKSFLADDVVPDRFAVRVSGTSMDGGQSPLHDGDWAVLRLARDASAEALRGRVVLAQLPAEGSGHPYVLKRLVNRGGGWILASDNPDGPTIPATKDTIAVARLERSIRPEDLAPPIGTVVEEDDLATSFGLEELPTRTGRFGGHLLCSSRRRARSRRRTSFGLTWNAGAPVRQPSCSRRARERLGGIWVSDDGAKTRACGASQRSITRRGGSSAMGRRSRAAYRPGYLRGRSSSSKRWWPRPKPNVGSSSPTDVERGF